MLSFYATGLVFYVWPVLILSLLFEYLWDLLSITVAFKVFPLPGGLRPVIRKHFFATWVVSTGCNFLLVGLILVLEVISQGNERLSAWLEAPFASTEGTLLAILMIVLVLGIGFLKSFLYRRFVFKKPAVQTATLQKSLLILSLMTTPWLFLCPTKWAAGVLGEIMIKAGSLAGYSADEEAVQQALDVMIGN